MAGWLIALQVLAVYILGSHAAYSEAGHYLVTAPQTATIGQPYKLTVQVFDTPSPVNVSAYIEYDNMDWTGDRHYVVVTPAVYSTLHTGDVGVIILQVPAQIDARFNTWRLRVRGTGGLQIEESHSIQLNREVAAIFLQTDKERYTAGDTVTLKTFALYPDLKPYTGPYTVSLKETGSGTLMKTWTTGPDNINTFSYTLDTHTVSGMTFEASATGLAGAQFAFTIVPLEGSKYMGIKQDTPGNIEVKVHLPKTMNSSTALVGSFSASYPLGVEVKGTAEVELIGNGVRKQTIQFQGSATFTFPFTDLTVQNTRVKVTVTDEVTGQTGSGESTVQVFERDVKIEFHELTPRVFKPHLPYTFHVKITNNADEPLHVPADSMYSVVLVNGVGHYQRTYDQAQFGPGTHQGTYPILSRRLTLPDSGLLSVELEIPDDVNSVDLRVTFQGVQATYNVQRAQPTQSDNYLQLYLQGHVPPSQAPNADIRFRVLSSQPFTDLTVELVSGREVITSFHPTLTSQSTSGHVHSAEFSVTLRALTPVVEVVVYQTAWVNRNGVFREIITDSMALNVPDLLQNQVTVTSSTQRAPPGEEVVLHVQARPGSAVGVVVEEDNGATVLSLTSDKVASYVGNLVHTPHPSPANEAVCLSSVSNTAAFTSAKLLWIDGTGSYYASTTRSEDIHGECVDRFPDCSDYDRSTACVGIYEPWAKENCPRYCGYCVQPVEEVGCHDVIPDCDGYGRDACLGVYAEWAVLNCPLYCGYCGPTHQTSIVFGTSGTNSDPRTIFLGTNTTGQDGSASFSVRLPDSVNTWSVTGFAFDSAGHLGFVTPPLKIEAAYDVYAEVEGASHVVSDEHSVLRVLVHNTLAASMRVTVTLRPVDNVEVVTFAQDHSFNTAAQDSSQTFSVPAKISKQIFFTVTSPGGRYVNDSNANVEIDVISGASKQTVPFVYTVVSPGAEQTFALSELISVDGHVTKDLSVSLPRDALPGTDTHLALVTETLTEQLLPLALGEKDVMEEGTGMAALLHLALPVMLARWRPDLANQLHGPIERGYQRLVTFMEGHPGIFRSYTTSSDLYSNWLNLAAMQYIAEANDHVTVDVSIPRQTFFEYFKLNEYYCQDPQLGWGYHCHQQTFPLPVTGHITVENDDALKAFLAIGSEDIQKHLNVSGSDWYTGNQHNLNPLSAALSNLTFFVSQAPSHHDALTFSYLALAAVRLNLPSVADQLLTTLLAMQDPAGTANNETFWNSNANDTYNYFGAWLPGRHVAESRDIVTAANVLQVLVAKGRSDEATRVAKWLVRQRTESGLFKTAWDTVTALEALLMFDHQPQPPHTTHNQLHLHTQWGVNSPTASLTASGHGAAFSLVTMKYHVTHDVGSSPYEVVPVVLDESLQHFRLMVCSRWLLKDRGSDVSVQEVTLPSGFSVDTSDLTNQRGVFEFIKRTDGRLTIYFSKIEESSQCYVLQATRVHDVARSAPGYIVTTSFNHPELHDIVMFHPQRLEQSSVCDLCTACCPKAP